MKQNEPKISQNRQKKEEIVAGIVEKMEKAKALVFANYQGLTHKQIEDLKKRLKPADAEMSIAKNTLIKIALEKTNNKNAVELHEDALTQPTATLFAYSDIIAPLRELTKAIKEFGGTPTIKFGIFEKKTVSADEIVKLSMLPSKEVLIAQVLAGLQSPISGFHRALNWNLQTFVMTLKAIESKKSATSNQPLG